MVDGVEIESLKAYLSTVVTRLAMDHLRSAHARREEYVGLWLPEQLPTDASEDDPLARAELANSLSMAFLLVLERLSPAERAARSFAGLGRQMGDVGARFERRTINRQPAAVVLDREGAVVCVWVLDVADGRVGTVRSVINPGKLRHLGRTADVRALAAGRGRM